MTMNPAKIRKKKKPGGGLLPGLITIEMKQKTLLPFLFGSL